MILTTLALGLGRGQSSHREFTSELVMDLAVAIMDSTIIENEKLHFEFHGDLPRTQYLNSCIPESFKSASHDSLELVLVEVQAINYMINELSGNALRNSSFKRSLALEVKYEYAGEVYSWKSKISDNLTKAQLRVLLHEPYPVAIGGDHKRSQPRIFIIILTTLSVFSLGAALFFIRT